MPPTISEPMQFRLIRENSRLREKVCQLEKRIGELEKLQTDDRYQKDN